MRSLFMTVVTTVIVGAGGLAALDAVGVVEVFGIPNVSVFSFGSSDTATGSVATGGLVTGSITTGVACGSGMVPTLLSGSEVCIVPEPMKNLDCIDPNGATVAIDTSVTLYKPEVGTCAVAEFKCNNGNLESVGLSTTDYKFMKCVPLIEGGIPCTTPRNEEMPDGGEFLLYKEKTVNKDADCTFEKAVCLGGVIKQKFGYKEKSCIHANNFAPEFITANPQMFIAGTTTLKPEFAVDKAKPGEKSCTRFGKTINPTENVYAFKDQAVPFENDCDFEVKVCRDGIFTTPNKGYKFKECFIGAGLSCSVGTFAIDHAKVDTFYAEYDKVLKDCPKQVRRCRNGTADGDTIYKFKTCKKPYDPAAAGPARCPNPYYNETKVLDHNRNGVGYFYNTVPFGFTCDDTYKGQINKVSVNCQYGAIKPIGNTQKIRRTCSVGNPKPCTTPRSATVAHGNSVTAYAQSSVGFGQTCVSEVRVCTDTNLAGTYTNSSCTVNPPLNCTAPRGSAVTHNTTITTYLANTVPFGQTCASQTRLCTNGALAGTYINQSCSINPPVDCTFQGVAVAHGATVTRHTPIVANGNGDDLEGNSANQCARYSAKCTNGTMAGNLLSRPEATVPGKCVLQ